MVKSILQELKIIITWLYKDTAHEKDNWEWLRLQIYTQPPYTAATVQFLERGVKLLLPLLT